MKIAQVSLLTLALMGAVPLVAKEKAGSAPQLTADQQAMMQAWEKASQPGEQHAADRTVVARGGLGRQAVDLSRKGLGLGAQCLVRSARVGHQDREAREGQPTGEGSFPGPDDRFELGAHRAVWH